MNAIESFDICGWLHIASCDKSLEVLNNLVIDNDSEPES